jgi:hypothetical protein
VAVCLQALAMLQRMQHIRDTLSGKGVGALGSRDDARASVLYTRDPFSDDPG